MRVSVATAVQVWWDEKRAGQNPSHVIRDALRAYLAA